MLDFLLFSSNLYPSKYKSSLSLDIFIYWTIQSNAFLTELPFFWITNRRGALKGRKIIWLIQKIVWEVEYMCGICITVHQTAIGSHAYPWKLVKVAISYPKRNRLYSFSFQDISYTREIGKSLGYCYLSTTTPGEIRWNIFYKLNVAIAEIVITSLNHLACHFVYDE